MVQLTRIYTKSGDKGKTSLGNGKRVSKCSTRIEAIGAIDEVNCFLGLSVLKISDEGVRQLLLRIQNDLFDLGADLCLPDDGEPAPYEPLRVTHEQVVFLENKIDQYNADLSDLRSFILPGGTEAASALHLARSIARRAERWIILLSEEEAVSPQIIQYINRLSDLLFVLARWENHLGKSEILWVPGANR